MGQATCEWKVVKKYNSALFWKPCCVDEHSISIQTHYKEDIEKAFKECPFCKGKTVALL